MPLEGPLKLVSWIIPLIILAIIILPQAIRILREYERGVIFRLGKLLGAKGPGLIFLIPIVDRMVRMDLRVVTINVERQEVMTRDNVPVTVDAVVYFRVVDPIVIDEMLLGYVEYVAHVGARAPLGFFRVGNQEFKGLIKTPSPPDSCIAIRKIATNQVASKHVRHRDTASRGRSRSCQGARHGSAAAGIGAAG